MADRPYLRHEHPIRLAHRGSTVLWPENTMTAFQGAVELGYRYVETDVHRTGDGVIVAFHDDDLERLTNGSGRVSDWRWEDLRLLDAGYWFGPEEGFPRRDAGDRIPALEEVLTTWPSLCLNLDLKQPGIEEELAHLLSRLGAEDRVLVASFHDRRLRRFRRACDGRVATSAGPAEALRMWSASRVGRGVRQAADAYQLPGRMGRASAIDRPFVSAAHRSGAHVHAWTVNDTPEMHRLLDLGVDGIITDRPDLLNEVVAARAAKG